MSGTGEGGPTDQPARRMGILMIQSGAKGETAKSKGIAGGRPNSIRMKWRSMRWRLFLLSSLFLGGCSSEWTRQRDFSAEVHSVYPQNYKAEIVALMRTYLNDPTGVRNAAVSEPTQRTVDGVDRYAACVRYDARKSGGQYAGTRDSMVLFRGGRLDRIVDNEMARQQCRAASYAPFPELQRITR